jgi:acetyl/propionyl-CoA carboxylase alpha subunit
MPAGPGVRLDTALAAGERVAPDYDPLIAKILVVDSDRPAAIGRLARALDETLITGIQTTLPFHRWVVADPGFRAADLSIDLVDERWADTLRPGREAALEAARWAAADLVAGMPEPGAVARLAGGAEDSEWSRAGRIRAIERWPT